MARQNVLIAVPYIYNIRMKENDDERCNRVCTLKKYEKCKVNILQNK